MTNYGKYNMPVFIEEISIIKDLIKITLHTIFYHRWQSIENTSEAESRIFSNIKFIKLNNLSLEKQIEEKVKLIENSLINKGKVQIVLNFYQKKKKQYFVLETNENLWESWNFSFLIKSNDENDNLEYSIINYNNGDNVDKVKKNTIENRENNIREYIYKVIETLNSKIDYMPDFDFENINSSDNELFPYTVSSIIIIY